MRAEAAMIHSVTPKADLRVDRVGEDEPSGSIKQPPRDQKDDSEGRSLSRASADRAKIAQAAVRFNEVLSLTDSQLKIEVDHETDRVIVKIVEQESGEVIRQIPPEELLELEQYLSSPKGLLLQEQV
jgi:flagellar protein FlaG